MDRRVIIHICMCNSGNSCRRVSFNLSNACIFTGRYVECIVIIDLCRDTPEPGRISRICDTSCNLNTLVDFKFRACYSECIVVSTDWHFINIGT